MSRRSNSKVASYVVARAIRTMSCDGFPGISTVRASSRSRRFSLFRSTAECFAFGTMSPILDLPGCGKGETLNRTSRNLVRMRFPSRNMRCRSGPRVIRHSRGNPEDTSAESGSGVLVRDPDRQLLTAFLASTGQCGTAPLRFHPCTESVRLQASRVTRPICWLSHKQTPDTD